MKDESSKDKKNKDTKPMAKEQPNTKRGEGVDDAGPAGQEARKKETDEANKLIKKKDKDNKKAAPPKSKKQGPSAGDIMGGKDGPQGPLGGELDKQRKKKKRSMMGTNRFGAGKVVKKSYADNFLDKNNV